MQADDSSNPVGGSPINRRAFLSTAGVLVAGAMVFRGNIAGATQEIASPGYVSLGSTMVGQDLWSLETRSTALEAVAVNQTTGVRLRPPKNFVARGVVAYEDDIAVFGAQLLVDHERVVESGDYRKEAANEARLPGEPPQPGLDHSSFDAGQTFHIHSTDVVPAVARRVDGRWQVLRSADAASADSLLAAVVPVASGELGFIAEKLRASDVAEVGSAVLMSLEPSGLTVIRSESIAQLEFRHQRISLSVRDATGTTVLLAGPQTATLYDIDSAGVVQKRGPDFRPEDLAGHIVGFKRGDTVEIDLERADGSIERVSVDRDAVGRRAVSQAGGIALEPGLTLISEGES